MFTLFITIAGEIIVRVYKLVPDIPKLYVDKTGIQRYTPGQEGYYTKATSKWKVNKYGWIGTAETKGDTIISIIGDSYIENMMNPISCNQGNILKKYFKNYSFFEAGRSGVTAIEAMQITRLLDSTIHPTFNLIYVAPEDFEESISNIYRYTDRVQIDLSTNTILNSQLKSPFAKKILYSSKILYYLYLRFSSAILNHNNHKELSEKKYVKPIAKTFNTAYYEKLVNYFQKNYNVKKIILVFHPGTDVRLINFIEKYGFITISLGSIKDKENWALNENDGHWSCFGHEEVAKRIKMLLPGTLKTVLNKKRNVPSRHIPFF